MLLSAHLLSTIILVINQWWGLFSTTQFLKTMFYYVIQTNYGYGWEDESTYEVGIKYAQVRHDADEYRLIAKGVRIQRRTPKIVNGQIEY